MKAEYIEEARITVLTNWGTAGEHVIAEAEKVVPFNDNMETFLTHCIACGGDWGNMLLTGIKELYPNVWEAIPSKMGRNAWITICSVLILIGVNTAE